MSVAAAGHPDLNQLACWVGWRLENSPDGKLTKVPYNPHSGKLASTTDRATWAPHPVAVAAVDRLNLSGTGFVFADGNPFAGIDLDHCRDPQTGKIELWAEEIILKLSSYTELSPSGTGVHIFVSGKLPAGVRCARKYASGKVEIYSRARFFTFTGQHLAGTPLSIEKRQAELTALHAQIFPTEAANGTPTGKQSPAAEYTRSDSELLAQIRHSRQGPKFSQLWAGDTSDYNGDESSADLALCNILAFWTGRDVSRIDALFRQSGLMRAKWDSRRGDTTYGSQTIARACATCATSASIKDLQASSRAAALESGSTSPRDVAASTAGAQGPDAKDVWSFPLTDLGNAERLVYLYGRDLRYCHPWGKSLVWDGSRFRIDDTAQEVRFAKNTTRQMFATAAVLEDSDKRDKALKHAKDSEKHARVRAMIELAHAEVGIPVLPEQLDADPWKLNVLNGTINLRDGSLQPHRRKDLITKTSPVVFDSGANCPTWLAFQKRITDGNEELLRFKQRALGYALTGAVTEKRALFIYQGATGNNGKTTELEIYREMLGDYAGQIPIESLLEQHRANGNGPSPDVADLRGLRLVISSEPPENKRLAEAKVKYLTGMGTIKARHLHRENFEFKQTWKIFLDCNPKPEIRGTDGAIWNRISLVPFEVEIPAEEIDPTLPEKLRRELPGILNWAIQGCLDWQQSSLNPPAVVTVATADYRAEMDVFKRFLEECCVVGEYASGRAQNLYAAYRKWHEESGERPESLLTVTSFGTVITKTKGITKAHDRQGVKYTGIGLRAE